MRGSGDCSPKVGILPRWRPTSCALPLHVAAATTARLSSGSTCPSDCAGAGISTFGIAEPRWQVAHSTLWQGSGDSWGVGGRNRRVLNVTVAGPERPVLYSSGSIEAGTPYLASKLAGSVFLGRSVQ